MQCSRRKLATTSSACMMRSENAFNLPRIRLLQHFNCARVGTIYQDELRYPLAHNRMLAVLDSNGFLIEETPSCAMQCNAAAGMKSFIDKMHSGPLKLMLLFRAACILATDPIAKASQHWHLTQLSYVDTHAMFTKEACPNFFSTHDAVVERVLLAQGTIAAALRLYQGWNYLSE